MNNENRIRLDQYLIQHELCESRNKAVWMIEQGWVTVNGKICTQKSYSILPEDQIEVKPDRRVYVSQGGYKLEKAIKEFELDLTNLVIMDVGASTGGFSDCALQHGAKAIVAIDIGENQLHPSLKHKITSLEKTDIRTLNAEDLPYKNFDMIVVDVSFISLELVFPYLKKFMKPGAKIIALVKPQFEQVERRKHKGGIIKDEKVRLKAIAKIQEHILNHGFSIERTTTTDADGKEKNIEYLILLKQQ